MAAADMPSEFEAELKRWGNSYAIRIPKEFVKARGLREGRKVRLLVLRPPDPRFYGMLKDLDMDPQRIKDELRREHAR